ncbi:hypothetical protein Hanom_Chr00s000001g01597101 [Helianthus anomalus]
MFNEQYNKNLENLNNWPSEFGYETRYDKNIYIKRFKNFLCMKNKSLEKLEKRFYELIIRIEKHGIWVSNDERISKFVDALPLELKKCAQNLKRDSSLSCYDLKSFINILKDHKRDEESRKLMLMDEMRRELEKINLDVINEMRKRISVCLAAQNDMKYDIKRGCYIDEYMNPLNFVKIFCAGTYKIETKKEVVDREINGKCSKCEKSIADNVKLMKDVESLTLKIRSMKDDKESDDKKILEMREMCEKLKSENVKLLNDLNSLTSEDKNLKEKEKDFVDKRKSSENEDLWINWRIKI